MITQSDQARAAWQATERLLDAVVVINGASYKTTDLASVEYDSGGYTGDTFGIGSNYENSVTIKFSHLVEGLKPGMTVKPKIGIKTSSGYEYSPLGVFIISTDIQMDRNNDETIIKCYDQMCLMENIYTSKLSYPAKVIDVIAEIANKAGVVLNTDDISRLPTQVNLPSAIKGQTYRNAIGMIAQFYAGFVTFDRDGKLTIRTLTDPDYLLAPSSYEQAGLTKNEATYRIGGISCEVTTTSKDSAGDSTDTTSTLQAGSTSGAQIQLTNNLMTVDRLEAIWEQLKTLNFYPFSLNWFGNPAIEAGDWLTLQDTKGNKFNVPNSSYTMTFDGSLSAVSKADQTSTASDGYAWRGELTQVVQDLAGRNGATGNYIYGPDTIYPPTNAKFNDLWYKQNGNHLEMWTFERQSDGSGKWVLTVSDSTGEDVKAMVKEEQEATKKMTGSVNSAVAQANVAVAQAGFSNSTASEAKSQAAVATVTAGNAMTNATQSLGKASSALTAANSAIADTKTANSTATQALTTASGAVGTANSALTVANDTMADFKQLDTLGRNYFSLSFWKENNYVEGNFTDVDIKLAANTAYTVSSDMGLNGDQGAYIFAGVKGFTPQTGNNGVYLDHPITVTTGTDGILTIKTRWFDPLDLKTLIMIAKGDKALPWVSAQEDITTQFIDVYGQLSSKVEQTIYDTLKGTVNTQGTQLSQTQTELAAKASSQSVNNLTKTVTDNTAAVKVVADGLQAKADSKTVDTLKQTVTSNTTAVKLASDGLKLKADSSVVDAINNTVATHTAEIAANANGLTSKVSQTDFDAMSIGGRNYALNSYDYSGGHWTIQGSVLADEYMGTKIFSSAVEWGGPEYKVADLAGPFSPDDYVTISAYMRTVADGQIAKVGVYGNAPSFNPIGRVTNEWQRFSATFKFSDIAAYTIRIEPHEFDATIPDMTVYQAAVQIEKGTKPTDWSPAPEDLATNTDLTDLTKTVTTQSTVSQQTQAEVALKADSKIVDTLKSTVANNSTSISTTAKGLALKADASVVNTLTKTVSNNSLAITANADQFKLQLSDTNTKLNSARDNLILKPWFDDKDIGKWQFGTSYYEADAAKTLTGHIGLLKFTLRDSGEGGNSFPVSAGETYYLEAYMSALHANYNLAFGIKVVKSDGSSAWISAFIVPKGTGLAKYTGTITIPADGATGSPWLQIYGPATEDLGFACGNGFRISKNASIGQVNGLAGTVSTHTTELATNTKNIALKASQTDVSTLTGRVTTAEGKLTVANNQILQSVTKTDLKTTLGSYATQSWTSGQISTTADSLKLSVSKVQSNLDGLELGGRNYLMGTANPFVATYNATTTSQYGSITQWKYSFGEFNKSNFNIGDILTWSFDWQVSGVKAYGNIGLYIETSPYAIVSATGTSGSISQEVTTSANSTQGHVTVTVKLNAVTSSSLNCMKIFARPAFNGTVTITNAKLEKGTRATDWSPAPEDAATQVQYSSLEVKLNGMQATVNGKASTSQVTQLSNQITSTITSSGATNYVYDPLFLDGSKSNWYNDGSNFFYVSNNAVSAKDGSASMGTFQKNIGTAGTVTYRVINSKKMFFSNDGSQTITATAWVKIYSETAGDVRFFIDIATFSNDNLADWARVEFKDSNQVSATTAAIGVWQKVTAVFKPTKAFQYISLGLYTAYHGIGSAHGMFSQPMMSIAGDIPFTDREPSASQITQLQDNINLRVVKNNVINQINISTEGVLIAGQKVHITGTTTIDAAVIKSANIASIAADKITTGTLNAANVNVINLNASHITTGTLTGSNLQINLNTGVVTFQKGRIHNSTNTLDINIDSGYVSVADASSRVLLKGGSIQFVGPQIFDLQTTPYLNITNTVAGASFAGASFIGRDYALLTNSANSMDIFDFGFGVETFSGISTGKSTFGWQPTKVGGAERGIVMSGGAKTKFNGYGADSSPKISIGVTDSSGTKFNGNRILIWGEYVHIPSAFIHTTSKSSNVFISDDGALVRSTSASKYKTNIVRGFSTDYGEKLINLPTATWIDKASLERYSEDPTQPIPELNYGMIAEDLAAAGVEKLVVRNENGGLEGIQYDRIAVALLPLIKNMKEQIEELKQKLEAS
ncbi:hypothetical protein C5Z25_01515 [Lactobacillus sp. CBA3605]|uniref:gp58-like family protein n=1 Tax=Lactobacillus sp. CBA3605 TaxID=2099788 RepID=UPI000CFCECCF|nr:gp58-like family protein [Lactobacillus sp. CBA3605]AVK60527.1 hypothetical protein C5Z25_01515 [Lactobacillus sp. CBA3605]